MLMINNGEIIRGFYSRVEYSKEYSKEEIGVLG
jgi:hypothetical protein